MAEGFLSESRPIPSNVVSYGYLEPWRQHGELHLLRPVNTGNVVGGGGRTCSGNLIRTIAVHSYGNAFCSY